jgi:hypothetical protein
VRVAERPNPHCARSGHSDLAVKDPPVSRFVFQVVDPGPDMCTEVVFKLARLLLRQIAAIIVTTASGLRERSARPRGGNCGNSLHKLSNKKPRRSQVLRRVRNASTFEMFSLRRIE